MTQIINHTVEEGNMNIYYLFSSLGDAPPMSRTVRGTTELARQKKLHAQRLILKRLRGLLKARSIAYKSVGYRDAGKLKAIHDLGYYISTVQHRAPERLFSMVVAHADKWRLILPVMNRNQMNEHIEGIIQYCKSQINK